MNMKSKPFIRPEVIISVCAAVLLIGGVGIRSLIAETSESILKIEPDTQLTTMIAPHDAKAVAFTNVKLTAFGPKDIVVKNIVIENKSMANDGVFSEVSISGAPVTFDERSLDSLHQYQTKKRFTIKAGSSMVITLYGNMASDLSAYVGQKPALTLVRVDTDAKIDGTLSIVGTVHTVNASLAIGSISIARGSRDPGSARTFSVVTKDAVFTSARLDIGSQEAIKLTSITWTQYGTIALSDLANVRTYVVYNGNTTSYEATPDADDTKKFWSSNLGDGIVAPKGAIVEVYIMGDVISGVTRTIEFDLESGYAVGEGQTYGYTIQNEATITGFKHTIGSGSLLILKANQDEYHQETRLGDINLYVNNEQIEIHSFELQLVSAGITNVKLWDSSGALIAGPVHPSPSGRVHFATTWVVPIGKTIYHVTGSSFGSFSNLFTVTAKGVTSQKDIMITDLASQ